MQANLTQINDNNHNSGSVIDSNSFDWSLNYKLEWSIEETTNLVDLAQIEHYLSNLDDYTDTLTCSYLDNVILPFGSFF